MIVNDSKYHKVNKQVFGEYVCISIIMDGVLFKATFDIEYYISKKYLTKQEIEAQAIKDFKTKIISKEKELTEYKKLLKKLTE